MLLAPHNGVFTSYRMQVWRIIAPGKDGLQSGWSALVWEMGQQLTSGTLQYVHVTKRGRVITDYGVQIATGTCRSRPQQLTRGEASRV